jgi:alkaline phosphatase
VLAKASNSAEQSGHLLRAEMASVPRKGDELKNWVNETLVQKGLGIQDPTDAELQLLIDHPLSSNYYFADMVSRRAQIGWSTHGHSAVDVNIYGTAGSSPLRGNRENIEIGRFLRNYLDVQVDDITKELEGSKDFKAAGASEIGWCGKIPSEEDLQLALRQHEDSHDKLLNLA